MAPNGNPATGIVDVKIGDRVRHLKFSWEVFEKLEAILGRGFLNGDVRAASFNGFTEMKVFLWGGLLHEEPKLTLEELSKSLDLKQSGEYSTAIRLATELAFPEELTKDKSESPPKPGVQ